MRKNGIWIYGALTLALILLLTGFLLLRRPGGAPRITMEKQPAAETRSLPADRSSALPQDRINVNTADVKTLTSLPGIGEVRAEAIVSYREEHGPFLSISDLLQVKGVGEGTLNKIKDLICVEDSYENSDH